MIQLLDLQQGLPGGIRNALGFDLSRYGYRKYVGYGVGCYLSPETKPILYGGFAGNRTDCKPRANNCLFLGEKGVSQRSC